MSKFYIATPIYYVNANPHIGHTYTTIAADVLARFHRSVGDETFFLTGTDEHGAKIEEYAEKAGLDPQIFADKVSETFREAWKKLNISNDRFIRTTEQDHIEAVQNALKRMHDNGDIYLGKYEGLYCKGCEQFKNEKDLVDGLCPDHKTEPIPMSEESYMFKMSKYHDILYKKIKNDEIKILPVEKKNEVLSFYENERLQDVSFSRKNVKWGITLPWDEEHTTYVWADAFLNYLTGLGWDGSGNAPEMWPADTQLMSKDILRVHTTIWPAMLLSLGIEPPKCLFIHGFFMIDGQKMSKSLGNVITPDELASKYGVDGTRYLLMSATPFGNDGDISFKKFDEKYNADLANGLGNLVARVSNLLEKNEIKTGLTPNSDSKLIEEFANLMNAFKFDEALKILQATVRACDEKLTSTAPWKMTDKEEVRQILEPIAQNILNAALLIEPFMPETAKKIILQFSEEQIKKGEGLFPRI